jgi:hypothetical protein
MRAIFFRLMVAGIFVVLACHMGNYAHSGQKQADITGTYILYREGDKLGKVAGKMKISAQQGNQFKIGIASPTGNPARDWKGKGVLKGDGGYYDWIFKDGKKGRTTFRIDASGNLHGKVRGSGINWDYVASKEEDGRGKDFAGKSDDWKYDGKFHALIAQADRVVIRHGGFNCCGPVDHQRILRTITDQQEIARLNKMIRFERN